MVWLLHPHWIDWYWPPLLRYRRGSARWIDTFFYIVLAILFATGAYSIATRAWSAEEVEQAVALFCDSKDQVIQFDNLGAGCAHPFCCDGQPRIPHNEHCALEDGSAGAH